jgi:hypothetical protein
VLSALSGALACHEEVRGLPRLADWAEYAIALYKYKHLDWGGYEGFMADWAVIEEGQHATTLEGSALAQAVVAVVDEHGTVEESPSKMLELLHDAAESEGLNPDKDKDFPKHGKRYIRLEKDSTPRGPGGRWHHNDAGGSINNMVPPPNPHTYGKRAAEAAETPYFPGNSKYTRERIASGENGGVLQGGKNAASVASAASGAYLSGKTGGTISGDAATENDMLPPASKGAEDESAGETPPPLRHPENASTASRLPSESADSSTGEHGEVIPRRRVKLADVGQMLFLGVNDEWTPDPTKAAAKGSYVTLGDEPPNPYIYIADPQTEEWAEAWDGQRA